MSPRLSALCLVLALVGCNGGGEDTDTGTPVEVAGPTLAHEAPTGVFVEGDSVLLTVTATDPEGVFQVQGSWRRAGSAVWETAALDAEGDSYTMVVDAAPAPGIEYFFRATDASQYAAVSLLPADGEDQPLTIEVLTQGATLPFVEDFEGTASTLYDLGWTEHSDGFPGYTFELTGSQARDTTAVQHGRGLEEIGEMDDWLVSPPLDFSGATSAQVQWWEHATFTTSANHSLWASTGSPDPEDGDFVEVASLPTSAEGEWERAVAVPLGDYVGEPLVYLAWRYQATHADVWTLDDIEVGPLTSDLRITDVAWTRFDPGSAGTLTVTLSNPSGVDAANVQLEGLVDAASGSFSAPVDVGLLAAGTTTTADLTLTVDAAFPDNSWLPIQLVATAGDSGATLDTEVLVGDATAATLGFTTFAEGLLVATVGTGDPAAPDLEVEATTRVYSAGSYELVVDLTPHAAMLPPGPGLDRWWTRISGASAGSLDGFSIDSGTESWVSDDLGAWPSAVETLYYLPRPPEPEVSGSVTTPTPVAPGDLVSWDLTLTNYGPATTGVTTAEVSTADPDVSLNTPGPFTLPTDWAENASTTLPLSFLVALTQDDSQPVTFEVTVIDELESFLVEVDVPVPWPLIGLSGAVVEDALTGDGDGLPDPGESFDLTVSLTNSGELDSFGPLVCLLSQEGGAASATIDDASALFTVLGAGETQDDTGLTLTIDSGASVGEDLQMRLTCTDDQATYTLDFELIVGEPPWRALTAIHDAVGDNQGYDWDFQSADYRVVGDTLQLRLTSAVPYDGSTLFLEGYLDSVGAPYFDYNLIVQSGVARMRGRDISGYIDLSNPTVTELDANTIQLDIDVPTLELVQNRLTVGFGAGYCGSSVYYCDHYPDAWGAPYQGMDFSLWAPMEW
ncbi:MAG: hypothetical protein EP330_10055 [Deltaproteobacteria bacterium]|nr:MAG: hypothetical protein EP330_10055 [Deltaproteobacteria bacterium]